MGAGSASSDAVATAAVDVGLAVSAVEVYVTNKPAEKRHSTRTNQDSDYPLRRDGKHAISVQQLSRLVVLHAN
jgi:hypothetical protein